METIDDIRREQGNPNAGDANGPPQPINHFFHDPGAGMRAAALVSFVVGVFITLIGIWTLVIPISIVGFCVILGAAILFARAHSEIHDVLLEARNADRK